MTVFLFYGAIFSILLLFFDYSACTFSFTVLIPPFLLVMTMNFIVTLSDKLKLAMHVDMPSGNVERSVCSFIEVEITKAINAREIIRYWKSVPDAVWLKENLETKAKKTFSEFDPSSGNPERRTFYTQSAINVGKYWFEKELIIFISSASFIITCCAGPSDKSVYLD